MPGDLDSDAQVDPTASSLRAQYPALLRLVQVRTRDSHHAAEAVLWSARMNGVSDDHLRSLGRLTINFGTLELYVAMAIWSLLDTDGSVAMTVTSQLLFRRRLDLLGGLAVQKLNGTELLATVQKFINEADDLATGRNRIVHSHLGSDQFGTVSILSYRAGAKGLRTGIEELAVPDIDRVAEQIRQLGESFVSDILTPLSGMSTQSSSS